MIDLMNRMQLEDFADNGAKVDKLKIFLQGAKKNRFSQQKMDF
jgi:hypothetical protein